MSVEIWHAAGAGLAQVFVWPDVAMLALGVAIGAAVGILPGLGGSATLAMLLPFTLALPAEPALALLMGVAAVVATTGDLTSILLGVPGEAIAAATVVDGHPMAVRGEAPRAIGASLASSLAGSVFGAAAIVLVIPFSLGLARSVASPELFMLAVLGVTFTASLGGTSSVKGLAAGGLGLTLATVGLDPLGATPRFTFGWLSLWEGIGPIPVVLGLFAIPEIADLAARREPPGVTTARISASRLRDGARDAARLWPIVLQSSAIGTMLGLVPGVGASISQWIAYGRVARRRPEGADFGRGAIEGIIAPSAANNATLGGSLVPALALGIPGGLLSAMLLSAMVLKGLVPGPTMLLPETQGGHLALVFTLVFDLVVANAIGVGLAVLLARPLIGLARLDAGRLVPLLILFVFVGAYTDRQASADLLVTCVMGAAGLAFVRYGWPRAPLLMGLVLGSLAESRLFLALDAFGWSWLTRPGVVAMAALIVASLATSARRRHWAGSTADADQADVHRDARGETLFLGALVALLALTFVAAGEYGARASLVPRIVTAGTIVLLLAVARADLRRRGGLRPSAPRVSPPNAVVYWIPLFAFVIWTLGFVVGAPLAVLAYLLTSGRQKATTAAGLSLASCALLYGFFSRVLHVPFPPGVLTSWAGLDGL